LSAAGYLAKAGKSVLVLEHLTVPGGYAHEFRRGHYRFEVALHAIDGVGPGGFSYPVLSYLEVLEQVNFRRLDPFYTVRFPEHEITAHADHFEYEAELIHHFPDEAKGIRSLVDAMVQTFNDVRRFMVDGQFGRRPPMIQIPTHYPNMVSAMSQCWGDFMGKYIRNQQLQAVFSTLWPYYGLPPSQLNAATFIFPWVSYHLFGAYYPEGGSMAMSRALEKTINKYGGEVRYKQTVTQIEINGGKAVAVETEKGLRVEADLIISNANPSDTMLKFVGRENLPEKFASKVEVSCSRPALSNLVVYLGLDRDLLSEGWKHHELFLAEGYDLEADYQSILEGRFEEAGMGIAYYNIADSTCTPRGGSVLVLMALAPWDYVNQWGTGGNLNNYRKNPRYLELKQDGAEKLLDRAEKLIPNLRTMIKYQEVATPLTNYRYSLNPGGSIYGSEQTVENMYLGRLNEKTPISNLFLAGAWVAGGGMSAALLSGRSAALRAKKYLDPIRKL
jgi:prolycopene isomerase